VINTENAAIMGVDACARRRSRMLSLAKVRVPLSYLLTLSRTLNFKAAIITDYQTRVFMFGVTLNLSSNSHFSTGTCSQKIRFQNYFQVTLATDMSDVFVSTETRKNQINLSGKPIYIYFHRLCSWVSVGLKSRSEKKLWVCFCFVFLRSELFFVVCEVKMSLM